MSEKNETLYGFRNKIPSGSRSLQEMVDLSAHVPVGRASTNCLNGVAMDQAENVFIVYGWDKLPGEILSLALSSHGWRLINVPPKSAKICPARLVLVYNPRSTVGLEHVHRARAAHPNAGILLLTGAITEPELLQFVEAGVSSYVGTHQRFADLVEAMRMTLAGCSRSSGRVMRLVIDNISRLVGQG